MKFNADGTYKSYGFRDGTPFSLMPYYRSGPTGMSQEDEVVSAKAKILLQDRYELAAESAENWLQTGDVRVGWDFGKTEFAPDILADPEVGELFMDGLFDHMGTGNV